MVVNVYSREEPLVNLEFDYHLALLTEIISESVSNWFKLMQWMYWGYLARQSGMCSTQLYCLLGTKKHDEQKKE